MWLEFFCIILLRVFVVSEACEKMLELSEDYDDSLELFLSDAIKQYNPLRAWDSLTCTKSNLTSATILKTLQEDEIFKSKFLLNLGINLTNQEKQIKQIYNFYSTPKSDDFNDNNNILVNSENHIKFYTDLLNLFCPIYSELNQTKPTTSLQCQLGCMLHPLCKSFVFISENKGAKDARCYLFSKYKLDLTELRVNKNKNKKNANSFSVSVGPKICSNFNFEDWDNDGISNFKDPCPLRKSITNTTESLCSIPDSSKVVPEFSCHWNPETEHLSSVLLFKDFRKNLPVSAVISTKDLKRNGKNQSHYSASTSFEFISSPLECREFCARTSYCKAFTYSFVEGCYLFKKNNLINTHLLKHKGLEDELEFGVLSGVVNNDFDLLTQPTVNTGCIRENMIFNGQLVWNPIPLVSMNSCQHLCKSTRVCFAWSHVNVTANEYISYKDSIKYNNFTIVSQIRISQDTDYQGGLCFLYSRLFNVVYKKSAISSTRQDCGSCFIDSDGDGTFDCHDYCPYDSKKVFHGLCGCNRIEDVPFCGKRSNIRRLKALSASFSPNSERSLSEKHWQKHKKLSSSNLSLKKKENLLEKDKEKTLLLTATSKPLEPVNKEKNYFKSYLQKEKDSNNKNEKKRFLQVSGVSRQFKLYEENAATDDHVLGSFNKNCFYFGQGIVDDGIIAISIHDYNPVTQWLLPDGTPNYSTERLPVVSEDCQLLCQFVNTCFWWTFEMSKAYGCNLYTSAAEGFEFSYSMPPGLTSALTKVSGPKYCQGTCTDGIKNQDEEMIDCGGRECVPCGTLCNDGKLNQNEEYIDCGGVCKPCTCLEGNGGCSQFCVTTTDTAMCFCQSGYRLELDGKTCVHVNPCTEFIRPPCSPFGCSYASESFKCSCPKGWSHPQLPHQLFCFPPSRGPCYKENTIVMDKLSELNNEIITTNSKTQRLYSNNAKDCRESCLNDDRCLVWVFANKERKNNEIVKEPGCHLQGFSEKYIHIPAEGITSGYKFNTNTDTSCSGITTSIHPKDLPALHSLHIYQYDSNELILEKDLLNQQDFLQENPSLFGITAPDKLVLWNTGGSILVRFSLSAQVFETLPELVRMQVMYKNNDNNLQPFASTGLTSSVDVMIGLSSEYITETIKKSLSNFEPISIQENGSNNRHVIVPTVSRNPRFKKNVFKETARNSCTTSVSFSTAECLVRIDNVVYQKPFTILSKFCVLQKEKGEVACGTVSESKLLQLEDHYTAPVMVNIGIVKEAYTTKISISHEPTDYFNNKKHQLNDFKERLESMKLHLIRANDAPDAVFGIRRKLELNYDANKAVWHPLSNPIKSYFSTDSENNTPVQQQQYTHLKLPECLTPNEWEDAIIQIEIKLEEPDVIHSIELFWKDQSSPQLVSVLDSLDHDEKLGIFHCNSNRVDRIILPLDAARASWVIEFRMPCNVSMMETCGTPYILNEVKVHLNSSIERSFTLNLPYQNNVEVKEHNLPSLDIALNHDEIQEQKNKVLVAESVTATEQQSSAVYELMIEFLPETLTAFVNVNHNQPIYIELKYRRKQSLKIQSFILIFGITVATTTAICVSIYFARSVLIEMKKNIKKTLDSQNSRKHSSSNNLNNNNVIINERVKYPFQIQVPVTSPGGTSLYSLLNVISRALSCISEEDNTLNESQLSNRSYNNFSKKTSFCRLFKDDQTQLPLSFPFQNNGYSPPVSKTTIPNSFFFVNNQSSDKEQSSKKL